MNSRQLRSMSAGDLRNEILALQREAFNLRMQKGTGQLTRPSQVKALRRDIARAKTILNERKRA